MTKSSDEKRPRRGPALEGTRFLLSLLAILIVAVAVFGVAAPGPLMEETTVVVPHGATARSVAKTLSDNSAIYNGYLFRAAAKLFAHGGFKAGDYRLTENISMAEIIEMMHDGRSIVHTFTVAEGLSSAEVTALVKATPILTGEIQTPAEGALLPETYRYDYGDARAALIARMQKGMQETLTDLWAKRDMNVPLKSPQEALVMASIVEKETGKPEERPRIAGIFYNRLKRNMRLQSDPTVIYGIVKAKGMLDHDLDHNDLAFPSPYNTYENDGLPPQPICNPGRASLQAVLHPETNDFLYFVADGTGGHVFSATLEEHNKNVTKWNAVKVRAP